MSCAWPYRLPADLEPTFGAEPHDYYCFSCFVMLFTDEMLLSQADMRQVEEALK